MVAIRGAAIDHLRLGSLVIRHHPAGVIESSALRFRLTGMVTVFKVDGVLGWNALRQMTVRIRYRDRTMHISAPQKQPLPGPRNVFGIVEPFVSLTDDHGQRLLFKLDTGASVSSLDERILARIDTPGLVARGAEATLPEAAVSNRSSDSQRAAGVRVVSSGAGRRSRRRRGLPSAVHAGGAVANRPASAASIARRNSSNVSLPPTSPSTSFVVRRAGRPGLWPLRNSRRRVPPYACGPCPTSTRHPVACCAAGKAVS